MSSVPRRSTRASHRAKTSAEVGAQPVRLQRLPSIGRFGTVAGSAIRSSAVRWNVELSSVLPTVLVVCVASWFAVDNTLVQNVSAVMAASTKETEDEKHDVETVQSAFLYNFAARHVKWPDTAHKDKRSAFVIGVLGDDPMFTALTETCRGRKSGERRIQVRVIEDVADATDCHILYLPEKREQLLPAVLEACKRRPVLVVTSSEEGVHRGAHIGFFLEKAKVRFAADPKGAKSVGLEVSSELLKLARVIERKDEGARQ